VTTPDGLPPLREVIRDLDLSAKKSLGQNFLLDLNLTRRIARAAGPLAGVTVVEVGPGPGGLTRALLLEGASRVVAIEKDERCLPALEAIAEAYPGRIEIVAADAKTVDYRALGLEAPDQGLREDLVERDIDDEVGLLGAGGERGHRERREEEEREAMVH